MAAVSHSDLSREHDVQRSSARLAQPPSAPESSWANPQGSPTQRQGARQERNEQERNVMEHLHIRKDYTLMRGVVDRRNHVAVFNGHEHVPSLVIPSGNDVAWTIWKDSERERWYLVRIDYSGKSSSAGPFAVIEEYWRNPHQNKRFAM